MVPRVRQFKWTFCKIEFRNFCQDKFWIRRLKEQAKRWYFRCFEVIRCFWRRVWPDVRKSLSWFCVDDFHETVLVTCRELQRLCWSSLTHRSKLLQSAALLKLVQFLMLVTFCYNCATFAVVPVDAKQAASSVSSRRVSWSGGGGGGGVVEVPMY